LESSMEIQFVALKWKRVVDSSICEGISRITALIVPLSTDRSKLRGRMEFRDSWGTHLS
jgi:hypothetical protein